MLEPQTKAGRDELAVLQVGVGNGISVLSDLQFLPKLPATFEEHRDGKDFTLNDWV